MPTTTAPTVRLAMWSGPRNISTAMMRSFGARPDAFVCDEPLYAHYLQVTQDRRHPGFDETLARHDADWRRVTNWLTGPVPNGATLFYQKQMAHHLLPNVGREWINDLTNCFLIRDPWEMLTSLIEFIPSPTLADTGLPQQVELFQSLRIATGGFPLVIDAQDVLENPRGMLLAICDSLDIPFYEEMLAWPPGLRETDGAWAPFFYDKVALTTSFGPYRRKVVELASELRPLLAECNALFEQLAEHRLRM